jgi:serine-type D-Ala-D-Ala carboxypeptidase (penicillin-binding protein 5/6)
MDLKRFYKLYVCLLIIIAIVISVFVGVQLLKTKNIASPLPKFLTTYANSQVTTLNLWLPVFEIFKSSLPGETPEITGKSALVYDLNDQKVLFSENPTLHLPMASLTKIMTAIIAMENPKKDDKYVVTQDDLVGEDVMGLSAGETLSLEELLYGLVLTSGNDAAETLAGNYSEGREKFIEAMNSKAKALGLSDTHFTNPTGLEGDGDQYTTTYDLLVMTKYAMQYPLFRKVVGTFDYNILYTSNHKAFYMENETNLLTSYPGVIGVKDGYTPEAGLCLVTYLNYKNHKIIGIILGSDNRRQEMKDLLDYSLRLQDIDPPPHG